jgi:hypothetical protein
MSVTQLRTGQPAGNPSAHNVLQSRLVAASAKNYDVPMTLPTTSHIRLDDRSVAWIDNTNTKVIEVALDMIAHGWSPEEIHGLSMDVHV